MREKSLFAQFLALVSSIRHQSPVIPQWRRNLQFLIHPMFTGCEVLLMLLYQWLLPSLPVWKVHLGLFVCLHAFLKNGCSD